MKKLISILLTACLAIALAIPCAALAEEDEFPSYEVSMDYEPLPVLLYDQGISIAIPADSTINEITEDLAAQGVLHYSTSPDNDFYLQIYLQMPALPDEYEMRLTATGVEDMEWINVNDCPFLIYTLPDQEHFFAVAFATEEGFALNFAFLTEDLSYLGELPYQILGTLRTI